VSVPFLCPVCSARLKSALLGRVHCARCGGSYPPTHVDRLARALGTLLPQPRESAEALHARAIEHLRKALLTADSGAHWNAKLATRAVRVLGTSGDVTGPAVLVLIAAPWGAPFTISVFNDLLRLTKWMEEAKVVSRFLFVAPQPIPESILYSFGATNRGRFERMALRETGLYDPEMLVPPARVPKLIALAQRLVKTCFRIEVDLAEVRQVKWIEELILKELRLPHSPHVPLPREAYLPRCSLLMLALLVGAILLGKRGGPGWCEERAFPFSLGLLLDPNEKIDPISPVVNLCANGAASSIVAVGKELTRVRRRH